MTYTKSFGEKVMALSRPPICSEPLHQDSYQIPPQKLRRRLRSAKKAYKALLASSGPQNGRKKEEDPKSVGYDGRLLHEQFVLHLGNRTPPAGLHLDSYPYRGKRVPSRNHLRLGFHQGVRTLTPVLFLSGQTELLLPKEVRSRLQLWPVLSRRIQFVFHQKEKRFGRGCQQQIDLSTSLRTEDSALGIPQPRRYLEGSISHLGKPTYPDQAFPLLSPLGSYSHLHQANGMRLAIEQVVFRFLPSRQNAPKIRSRAPRLSLNDEERNPHQPHFLTWLQQIGMN